MAPWGAPSQAMQQKINASNSPFSVRMTPYSGPYGLAQLFCTILSLVLLAPPLGGVSPKPFLILIPLATDLVPLGTDLQSPPAPGIDAQAFATSGRIVLGPIPSESSTQSPAGHPAAEDVGVGLPDSDLTDRPTGRAPPAL